MATLTYLQVHIFYNIPPLVLFWLLYRPLSTRGDVRKYVFLVSIAVLYTTPWDNYIIYRKAWQYCSTCVMGTIGLVPVEEYVFFVTQTLLTCFIHSLLTRCLTGLPAVAVRRHKRFPVVTTALVALSLSIGALQTINSWNNIKSFYMRAILLWTTPVLIFLFTISGFMSRFLHHRILVTLTSIAIPTLYLCIVDTVALRSGTWHINEKSSLELFVWRGLPLEEAVFFLVTNTMVVLGCTGFDLAFSIVHTYDQTLDFSFLSLCRALLLPRDESVVEDLDSCVQVLQKGSSSFYTSSFFFNEAVRRDLIVLYAFCRYTDDLTDNVEVATAVRGARLHKLTSFVMDNFLPKSSLYAAERKLESEIKRNTDPIQRSMLRYVAHKIPREPLLELLEGYQWDLNLDAAHEAHRIRFEEDLILYSQHVASSVAEMCTYVVDADPKLPVVTAAREMGVVLQFTNIARDIMTDAVNGRTYVPEAWFGSNERQELLRIGALRPQNGETVTMMQKLGPERHALRLIRMAEAMHRHSTGAIDKLPEDAQIGIRIATDGYFAIGRHLSDICSHEPYPLRARLPRFHRLKLALWHLYRPRRSEALIFAGCLLRLVLLIYGQWQDNLGSNVRYTDIDYNVFTDAARFMQAGGSPYERATYRYTPVLAWLLIPNQYFLPWGKVLFALGDIFAGWFMIKLLRSRNQKVDWAAAWLLNPMVAVISTRGNCEGLLGAMAVAMLYAIEFNHVAVAGLLLGLAVHFKVYPLIYAPSVFWALRSQGTPGGNWTTAGILDLFNRQRLIFAFVSLAAFTSLSALMFHIYGTDFLQHTFFYHISRSDHRHNFSPYHLFLYLSSATGTATTPTKYAALVAFIPQMLLSLVVIPLTLAQRNLTACFLAQTFAFVAFNKVVTSQYFMWYLVFLPLYLPDSSFLTAGGAVSLGAWVGSQALWLYYAYGFEILGQNTFYEMWLATLLFFGVNMYILGRIVHT